MKTKPFPSAQSSILLLMFAFPFLASGLKASPSHGLSVSFRVMNIKTILRDYSLSVYCNGELTDSIHVRKSSTFALNLEFNNTYILRINQPGFRERLVMIDTKVPDRKKKTLFEYSFDINMLLDSMPANTMADLPAMLVQYNSREKAFDYSDTYSKSVGHLPEFTKERRFQFHLKRKRIHSV